LQAGPSTHAVGSPFFHAPQASAAITRLGSVTINSSNPASRSNLFITPPRCLIAAEKRRPSGARFGFETQHCDFSRWTRGESILMKSAFNIQKISIRIDFRFLMRDASFAPAKA
jgi:hypothetical protein